MKPLNFQFKEIPTEKSFDFSVIEYDKELNLSVDKQTRKPAIDSINMGTETYTKTMETSDADHNAIGILMDTETYTRTHGESTDSDYNSTALLMDTHTSSFNPVENTDADNQNNFVELHSLN